MLRNAVIHQDRDDVAVEDVDGVPIEQPIQLVIDITTGAAIRLNETRFGSVWREFNVR